MNAEELAQMLDEDWEDTKDVLLPQQRNRLTEAAALLRSQADEKHQLWIVIDELLTRCEQAYRAMQPLAEANSLVQRHKIGREDK